MINFLSRLPNKYLMIGLFLIVFFAYLYLQTDFLGNLADKILTAIVALLGLQRSASEYADKQTNKPSGQTKCESVTK